MKFQFYLHVQIMPYNFLSIQCVWEYSHLKTFVYENISFWYLIVSFPSIHFNYVVGVIYLYKTIEIRKLFYCFIFYFCLKWVYFKTNVCIYIFKWIENKNIYIYIIFFKHIWIDLKMVNILYYKINNGCLWTWSNYDISY